MPQVYLNQDRVFPSDYRESSWVLDTSVTNHMTGCRASLSEFDESVGGLCALVMGRQCRSAGSGL
jgi:hypothetical protein